MDARDYQLGEVISQEDKPIYFYSHNLTGPQTQYTVTENESLIVVETLKEFCMFLFVQQLKIYTDHKNLTCKNFNTNSVLR